MRRNEEWRGGRAGQPRHPADRRAGEVRHHLPGRRLRPIRAFDITDRVIKALEASPPRDDMPGPVNSADIAARLGVRNIGGADTLIEAGRFPRACRAAASRLLLGARYRAQLAATRAGAVSSRPRRSATLLRAPRGRQSACLLREGGAATESRCAAFHGGAHDCAGGIPPRGSAERVHRGGRGRGPRRCGGRARMDRCRLLRRRGGDDRCGQPPASHAVVYGGCRWERGSSCMRAP